MNAIFDQGARLAADVSYTETGDATANWFKQKGRGEINMGKKCDYNIRHNNAEWNFLQHHAEPDGNMRMDRPGEATGADTGLGQTRFHKGFQRRPAAKIVDAGAREEREAQRAAAAAAHLERRRRRLGELDRASGLDVITGEHDPGRFQALRPGQVEKGGKRIVGDHRDHPERRRYQQGLLMHSHSRFHRQPPSGEQHDRRQDVLVREGLVAPKQSSVLGYGRRDVYSYGVEDQLAKSNYCPQEKIKVEGHFERNRGGRWTPGRTGMYPAGYWEPTVFPTADAAPHQVAHQTPLTSGRVWTEGLGLPPQKPQNAEEAARAYAQALARAGAHRGGGGPCSSPAPEAGTAPPPPAPSSSRRRPPRHHGSAPVPALPLGRAGEAALRSASSSGYYPSSNNSKAQTPMQRREQAQQQADLDVIRQLS